MNLNNVKSLIVGVDLSDYSNVVVREAKKLSTELHISLVYVFVYENIKLYQGAVVINRPMVSKIFEKQVRSQYGVEEDQKVFVKFGKPDEQILKVAKNEKNPLIMVGHKSGHIISRFFLGSIAEKLIANSPYPVWVHRGDKTNFPKKILIPSDLSVAFENSMPVFEKLQKTFKSDIEFFHVLSKPLPVLDHKVRTSIGKAIKSADDKRVKMFRKKHPATKLVQTYGDVTKSIQEHSKKYDLIAFSPQDNSNILYGRVTGKIVRSGRTPILVIPQR